MAKRYAISPVIGAGTAQNPYRAAIADVPDTATNGPIPTDNGGVPLYHFAPVIFSTLHLASVMAVTNAYVFPDYSLDGRMDGMESDARTGLVQSVQAYNMDGNGLHFSMAHADGDSYRAVILHLLQQFEPAFTNLNTFDVAEVTL